MTKNDADYPRKGFPIKSIITGFWTNETIPTTRELICENSNLSASQCVSLLRNFRVLINYSIRHILFVHRALNFCGFSIFGKSTNILVDESILMRSQERRNRHCVSKLRKIPQFCLKHAKHVRKNGTAFHRIPQIFQWDGGFRYFSKYPVEIKALLNGCKIMSIDSYRMTHTLTTHKHIFVRPKKVCLIWPRWSILFGVKHGRNEYRNTVWVRFYAGKIGLDFTADNFSWQI